MYCALGFNTLIVEHRLGFVVRTPALTTQTLRPLWDQTIGLAAAN